MRLFVELREYGREVSVKLEQQVVKKARDIAAGKTYATWLEGKNSARQRDEELEKMKQNFYGFDPGYHVARYNFVYKVPGSRTPLTLAGHRRAELAGDVRNVS